MKNSKSVVQSYISPNGVQMANPVLIDRQIDGLREVLQRLNRSQTSEVSKKEQMGQLQKLAQRTAKIQAPKVVMNKKAGSLRTIAKRIHSRHESSDSILNAKLAQIKIRHN